MRSVRQSHAFPVIHPVELLCEIPEAGFGGAGKMHFTHAN